MDIISAVVLIAGVLLAAFSVKQKLSDYLNFKKRRSSYDNALKLYKVFYKRYMRDIEDRDAFEKVKSSIIFSNKVFDDIELTKKTYENIIKIRLDAKELNEEWRSVDTIFIKGARGSGKTTLLNYYLKSQLEIEKSGISLLTGAGLVSSVIQQLLSSTSRSSLNSNTIVGVMVGKRLKRDNKAYLLLISAAVFQLFLAALSSSAFSVTTLGIILIFIGCLSINQRVLEYRIKRGLYGSTAYEANEIVQFITEHSDKSDFTDGGKKKPLAPESDERLGELVIYDGVLQQ